MRCQDIALTIYSFYFKLADGTYTTFKHLGEPNVSYDLAVPISEDDADWNNLFLQRVNQYVKIFTSFRICTQSGSLTYVIIAHGKFLSTFNIENWKWERHIYFKNDELMAICRRGETYNIILFNGEVYSVDLAHGDQYDSPDWKTPGKPLRVIQDDAFQNNFVIMYQDTDGYSVKVKAAGLYATDLDVTTDFNESSCNVVFV